MYVIALLFLTLIAILAILAIYLVVIYNRLVALKHGTRQAWSNIDVLLKQRHDELPKLVQTCKQHMHYERETLERVMQARAGVFKAQQMSDMRALGAAEGELRHGLANLFALAESYPDLKASATFQHLSARVTELENTIADRREYYNESVNNHNTRIEQFPDTLIAGLLNFKPFELLKFSEREIQDVDLQALFN